MVGRPVVVAVVLVLCARPSLQDCSTKETKAVQTEFQECSQGPFINYVISQSEFAFYQPNMAPATSMPNIGQQLIRSPFSYYLKCHSYSLTWLAHQFKGDSSRTHD